jgi:hypothetical protein
MPASFLSFGAILVWIVLQGGFAYFFSKKRVAALSAHTGPKAHSLRCSYGLYAAIGVVFPALVVVPGWTATTRPVLDHPVMQQLAAAYPDLLTL